MNGLRTHAGLAAIVLLATIGVSGCGGDSPRYATDSPAQATTMTEPTPPDTSPSPVSEPGQSAVGWPACNAEFAPTASDQATLTLTLPATVSAADGTASGQAVLSATQPTAGVAATQADIVLIQRGRVVSQPLPADSAGIEVSLEPGQTREFPAIAGLRGCSAAAGPLEPGEYQAIAMITIQDATSNTLLTITSAAVTVRID